MGIDLCTVPQEEIDHGEVFPQNRVMQGRLSQFVEGVDGAPAADEILYRRQVACISGSVKSLALKPIIHRPTPSRTSD
jgi:hypothetical protein